MICLHARLDAVKWESGEGRKYTGSASGDLGSVSFDEEVGVVVLWDCSDSGARCCHSRRLAIASPSSAVRHAGDRSCSWS
jgi:hypothetical protein